MKKALLIFIVISLYTWLLVGYIFPALIDSRAEKLGLLQYDSTTNKMIVKDSVTINDSDLYYIKFGTMEGYQ